MKALTFKPKIAFIDSGIGGFSIAQSVLSSVPNADFLYFMDNRFLPYGELSDTFLKARLLAIADYLLTFHQPDVIVVACNTASTLTLSQLREYFSIPFVGVVPAIKPAAETTQTGKVVLLATPSTIKNPYTHALMHNFASHIEVELIGSCELVRWAENAFWQVDHCELRLQEQIREFVKVNQQAFEEADRVVLGCTHFPFLRTMLQECLGTSVELVDSAAAVARQTASVVAAHQGIIDPSFRVQTSPSELVTRVTADSTAQVFDILHTGEISDQAFASMSHRFNSQILKKSAVTV